MATAFAREEIERLAALARLELDESEIESFGRQLGEILEYARAVQRIDTTGVPPTAGVARRSSSGADRADEVQPSIPRDEALANAPDAARDAGLFKVPRVLG
jgi:aspartyl-tRNA(Asn)/glutamyl-tRNA(Gln) amidotransferase subunit C